MRFDGLNLTQNIDSEWTAEIGALAGHMLLELTAYRSKQFRRKLMVGMRNPDDPLLEMLETFKMAGGGKESLPDE